MTLLASPLLALCSLLFGAGASLVAFYALSTRRRATALRLARFIDDRERPPVGSPPPELLRLGDGLSRLAAHGRARRAALVGLLVLGIVAGLAFGSLPGFGVAAGAGALLIRVNQQAARRGRIARQEVAAVTLLASGLRAGYSLPQAVALVARESPEPTASQFARVAQEIDLGTGLVAALTHLAKDAESPDYELLAAIVAVQHEVGGNLAAALDAVAETLRERLELREQVQALTAQQRLSSVVLTILPMGLFLFLLLSNRRFVEPLLSTVLGRVLLLLVGLLLAGGWVVMRAIGRVEE